MSALICNHLWILNARIREVGLKSSAPNFDSTALKTVSTSDAGSNLVLLYPISFITMVEYSKNLRLHPPHSPRLSQQSSRYLEACSRLCKSLTRFFEPPNSNKLGTVAHLLVSLDRVLLPRCAFPTTSSQAMPSLTRWALAPTDGSETAAPHRASAAAITPISKWLRRQPDLPHDDRQGIPRA